MKDDEYIPAENEGFVKTKHLKEAIRHMEKDDKLHLNAEVEVYIENDKDEKLYGIVCISHFNILPNLVLTIREKE